MKVLFISGAYRANGHGSINENINHARKAAIELWRQGYAVITPHLNTAHFDGLCPDEVWLAGDIEILKRCDVIYMLNNWQSSAGAKAELEYAKTKGMVIMYED